MSKLSETFAAVRAAKVKTIEVAGQNFRLRKLTGAESEAFHAFKNPRNEDGSEATTKPSPVAIMANLLGLALSTESGDRELTNEEAAVEIPKLPIDAILELFRAAAAHNALTEKDLAAAEKKSAAPGSPSSV